MSVIIAMIIFALAIMLLWSIKIVLKLILLVVAIILLIVLIKRNMKGDEE